MGHLLGLGGAGGAGGYSDSPRLPISSLSLASSDSPLLSSTSLGVGSRSRSSSIHSILLRDSPGADNNASAAAESDLQGAGTGLGLYDDEYHHHHQQSHSSHHLLQRGEYLRGMDEEDEDMGLGLGLGLGAA